MSASSADWIRERLRRAPRLLTHWRRAIALIAESDPAAFTWWIASLLTAGLTPAFVVLGTRRAAEQLTGGLDAASTPWVFGPFAAALALGEVAGACRTWSEARLSEAVRAHMTELMHEQSARVDISFHDQPDQLADLHKAQREATYRPLLMVTGLGQLAEPVLTLLALAPVAWRLSPWAPFALLAVAAVPFLVQTRARLAELRSQQRLSELERRRYYADWLLTNRQTAAELRAHALGATWRAEYARAERESREFRLASIRRDAWQRAVGNSAGIALGGGVALWTVLHSSGPRNWASALIVYQGLYYAWRALRTMLDGAGQCYVNGVFLQGFFDFLSIPVFIAPPAAPRPVPAAPVGITCRGVWFGYPASSASVLRGLDLEILAGRVTVIVGVNGAGKSTILKLLCRLYDPARGTIEIGGADIREFDPAEIRQAISWLPPHPVRLNDTVERNITLGRAGRLDDAVDAAGAREVVAALPNGLQTVVGSGYRAGHELSSGQWQRILLARALYRDAPILLLDEPTSAMDPWREAEWFEALPEVTRGRTVVVVTHRFAHARVAPLIVVVRDGAVVEQGSHDELIARGGVYASGFRAETREYR